MEGAEKFETLAGGKLDGGKNVSNGPAVVKDDSFKFGGFRALLENVAGNWNGDGFGVELEDVAGNVIPDGVNLEGPGSGVLVKPENVALNKGSSEGEFKMLAAPQFAGDMKEVLIKSFENFEVFPERQGNLIENSVKEGNVNEVAVGKLSYSGCPPLLVNQMAPIVDDGFKGEEVQSRNFVGQEIMVPNEVGSFTVGDLVWVMARNGIWLPGQICDPLEAPKHTAKGCDAGRFMVRHFGTGSKNLVWCPASHLKHFLENFKVLSGLNKSKSFFGAIEKAVEEVGKRLKLEMSCSCISKDVQARLVGHNNEEIKPWYINSQSTALNFEPTLFVNHVRSLARGGPVPGILELVDIQSKLSAYNCYLGHVQMSIRQLKEVDGRTEDKTVMTAEEGLEFLTEVMDVESGQSPGSLGIEETQVRNTEDTAERVDKSRERKRSKYLSFPFVDPKAAKPTRDKTYSSGTYGKRSAPGRKQSVYKSIIRPITFYGDLRDLKVSPAQLLTEVRDYVRGCFYLKCNTLLDSTFDFFCAFRRFAFSNIDCSTDLDNDSVSFQDDGSDVLAVSPISEIIPPKRQKKTVTQTVDALIVDTAIMNPEASSVASNATARKRGRPKKDSVIASDQPNRSVSPNATARKRGRPKKDLAIASGQTNSTSTRNATARKRGRPKKDLAIASGQTNSTSTRNATARKRGRPKKILAIEYHQINRPVTPNSTALERGRPEKVLAMKYHNTNSTGPVPDLNMNGDATKPPSVNPSTIDEAPEAKSQSKRRNSGQGTTTSDLQENGLMEANVETLFGAGLHANVVPRMPENAKAGLANPAQRKLHSSEDQAAETKSGLPDLNGNDLDQAVGKHPNSATHADLIPAPQPAAGFDEQPPLSVIQNNLEAMTRMLDQSGNNLSSAMRAKLENDVQGLLNRIKGMGGSSSS